MNKGKLALLFTFAACFAVIVFFWLLAVPPENFTADRIVMVLLISPIFAILLAFNLSRFLKQHGYSLRQVHVALEQNIADFIYEFQRLVFIHLMPIAFLGALIFYYGEFTPAIAEFLSLFALIFALSPLLFLGISFFVAMLQVYERVRKKSLLRANFFNFWIWIHLFVILLIIISKVLVQPSELPFQKAYFKALNDGVFNLLIIATMNAIFGVTGRMVAREKFPILLHLSIPLVNSFVAVKILMA
ncbi:MAG: hypothetical protein XD40_0663 [Archaeoglobus fulgidus]|uniref:Uncharacterized protein n=1 Tax=Archaeoglobus fulgidus TaxID=2234 RepID=A0A101DES6_ARCFL|nr:hypothetical protein [Archaeoglobus fulgidus]KUJ94178.1 MAG: hypothetical protein XD40_0663 [Archaeoglobus fulgidus]KUK05747.1 MAG: Uncharacterized protein XD48_2014 [Archaeoglobus fulgidus]